MNIGISTACFYPTNTEEALLRLAQQGFRNVEIFINCDMELENPVRAELLRVVREYEMNILSVHPVPGWENFYLFSDYERRKLQFMNTYERYFEFMNELGAEIMVFHGSNKISRRSDELYIARFAELCALAGKYKITVAQENVAYCKSGSLDFLAKMKKELGAKFTLDMKQALRSGYSPFQILEKLGENIVHIHASDNCGVLGSESFGDNSDCLPIGCGNFDFAGFFAKLKDFGYNKGIILELYRENFSDSAELKESVEKLVDIYKKM
ncbi:MAG: sugar phosphate isomerase/epimerase [Oscillospiraceae bacterium]|jgi:sugar phosphate isomerase/epimerase|nr:sugar phosphate isomerase/epimerase [Oscillospiraceae bacterium]